MNIYTDDTAIHVCGTDFKNIQKRLQEEVDKVVQWFHSNRLVIINLKCCCMIISSHTNQNTLNIYVDDVKISQVDSTKNWREHVLNVKKKFRPKLDLQENWNILYPKTVWLNSIWQLLNHKSITVYLFGDILSGNFDWNVRGIDIVKDLGWLNVCQPSYYFTAITVYKSPVGLQPSYITDLFTLSRDIATRRTRSCCTNKLFLPKPNKSSFKCSLQYSGAIILNNLPDIIRNIDTPNVFKQTIKQFLTNSE